MLHYVATVYISIDTDLAPIIAIRYVCTALRLSLCALYYNIIIYAQFIRFYTGFIKLFAFASLKTKDRYVREKNRGRALALTATSTCSRSKSIMQIAQSQESMRKSRGGVDSSVVRAKLSSRCYIQDATCKSMFRQRKPGKRRFYDIAAVSPTVYPASSLHIFSSLCVWRTGTTLLPLQTES